MAPRSKEPPTYNPNVFSSPPQKVPNGEVSETARAKIRAWKAAGWSTYKIIKESQLKPTTVKRIVKAESSHRTRKGKTYNPHLITTRELSRIIRHVTKSYSGRKLTWHQVKSELHIKASASTIRRALSAAGFRRCIACPRPFISKAAAKRRLAFAKKHRWWGTSDWAGERAGDWRKVIWSDEAIFETGKIGRVWVTRRPDQKHCETVLSLFIGLAGTP